MSSKQVYFLALMLATFVIASLAEPMPESVPEGAPEPEANAEAESEPEGYSGSASIGAHMLTFFISSLAYVLLK